jgi:hypothetical protein
MKYPIKNDEGGFLVYGINLMSELKFTFKS